MSAWQTIHKKCQDLLSMKNNQKQKYLNMLSAVLVTGTFRVKPAITATENEENFGKSGNRRKKSNRGYVRNNTVI